MGRNLSGETPIVASSIHVRKDTYSMVAGRQTILEDIYAIFLAVEKLRTTGALDENSDGMASERLVAAFVRGLHALCTLNTDTLPTSRLSDFQLVMQAYRHISNVFHTQTQLYDPATSSHFNLLTRLQEVGGDKATSYFILDQEP